MTDAARITDLEARVAKLEKTPEIVPNVGPMTKAPRMGTVFWAIRKPVVDEIAWNNSEWQYERLEQGRCYSTKEAADAALKPKQAPPNTVTIEAAQHEANMAELTRLLRAFLDALKGSAALLDNLRKRGCKL